MIIEKRLPFECCEKCEDFILDVNEQTIFYGENSIRVLTVECKNESLCRRLDANRKRCSNENGH